MALWIRGHGGQRQQHVEDGGQLDPAPRSHNIGALEELETVNCHFMDDRLHSSILALPSAISIKYILEEQFFFGASKNPLWLGHSHFPWMIKPGSGFLPKDFPAIIPEPQTDK